MEGGASTVESTHTHTYPKKKRIMRMNPAVDMSGETHAENIFRYRNSRGVFSVHIHSILGLLLCLFAIELFTFPVRSQNLFDSSRAFGSRATVRWVSERAWVMDVGE